MPPPVKLGQGVVFRPGSAHDERWAPNQFLSGFVTSISGDDASIVVFPDVYSPFYEMRVKRDDSLSEDRTWTPSVGEDQEMPEAPSDGQIYGRRNQAWTPISGEDQGFLQSIIISDSPPGPGLPGMAWLDSTINNFYVFEQGKWVEPGHINPPMEISVNISLPIVSGNVAIGEELFCSSGDWASSPSSFTYQWMQNLSPLPGQTTNRHTISAPDAGTDLLCVVTAVNFVGISQPAFSNTLTISAPINIVPPVIAGQMAMNGILTCSSGLWSTSPPMSFAYQWKRGATPIVDEVANTYQITPADAGTDLSCVVTATNMMGSYPASSNIVGITTPSNIEAPIISGEPYVSTVLFCSTGLWTNLPAVFTYQWKSDGVNVLGEGTNNTFEVSSQEVGTDITCAVVATNAFGAFAPVISNVISIPVFATLDPATAPAGIVVENNDLTVRHVAPVANFAGAMSTSFKSAGKFRFDCVLTDIEGSLNTVFLLMEGRPYDDVGVDGFNCVAIYKSDGTVWSNNADAGVHLGELNDGDYLYWVVDLDNKRVWIARNNDLYWNMDPSADPETGVGGIDFGLYGPDARFAPGACFEGTPAANEHITFNFGTTGLYRVAGFASGWTL